MLSSERIAALFIEQAKNRTMDIDVNQQSNEKLKSAINKLQRRHSGKDLVERKEVLDILGL